MNMAMEENSIKSVDVLGVVTEIRNYCQLPTNNFTVIKVDDGTGVIDCILRIHGEEVVNVTEAKLNEGSKAVITHLRRKNNCPFNLKLGDTIHAQGVISEFRGKKELKLHTIRLVTSMDEECHRVYQVQALYRDVYKIGRIKFEAYLSLFY
ncbi:uncharacterized protein LOC124159204 isoform X2 [Ischnura elegans]|uniref:uncharacterized protein LOC124159204 isoform X2 n=1 Tax=Ischnura elegans TaxID=197161 RepID=UPI001ED8855C|nr:uncharacterized protein LOC124159204 isoform X2 [Ischnura elegans]